MIPANEQLGDFGDLMWNTIKCSTITGGFRRRLRADRGHRAARRSGHEEREEARAREDEGHLQRRGHAHDEPLQRRQGATPEAAFTSGPSPQNDELTSFR